MKKEKIANNDLTILVIGACVSYPIKDVLLDLT